jgi:hypothetical protein
MIEKKEHIRSTKARYWFDERQKSYDAQASLTRKLNESLKFVFFCFVFLKHGHLEGVPVFLRAKDILRYAKEYPTFSVRGIHFTIPSVYKYLAFFNRLNLIDFRFDGRVTHFSPKSRCAGIVALSEKLPYYIEAMNTFVELRLRKQESKARKAGKPSK